MNLLTLPGDYELRVEVSTDGKQVVVTAWKDGQRVAELDASKSEAYPEFIRVAMVKVDSGHRRHGIATRLYVEAERAMGLKFVRGGYQSPEAKRLWAQKNRPFGVEVD